MMDIVRIATRKSPLALWQAEFVKNKLLSYHPNLQVEMLSLTTRGDILLDTPLAKIGGKGLFVKELQLAMLEGRADIAVHSMKDIPMEFPDGLNLAVICERGDPSDAFVSNNFDSLDQLPPNSVIGTSSLRRQCQIRHAYPHIKIRDLRGNVNTRLSKLDDGEFDAIILASAGLMRLDREHRIKERLNINICLPAGGQGAVGIECRSDDKIIRQLLDPLQHTKSALCVQAERAANRHLQGGCQVPIACHAKLEDGGERIYMRGLVGSVDGKRVIRSEASGDASNPNALGVRVAEELLLQGAERILADVYGK